jgi:NAD(P)-dependent dehydrogenase (short-subunit alcohol dehydrogenase family)
MEQLDDKVAVVTGSASGIGYALADALLHAGCRVVLADIEEPALADAQAQLAEHHGDRVFGAVTDVSDLASVEKLAAAAVDRFGQVDVLCNNAGVSTFNTIDHLTIDDWRWVISVDLWGVIHGVHTFLPLFTRQGTPAHIVNTASIAGVISGIAYLGPYAVSKVGVVSLSETLRQELEMTGSPIGVSVLCPSATNTNCMEGERNRPGQLGVEARTPDAEQWRLAIRSGFTGPAGKEPEEVAAMVVDAIRHNRFWVISHDDLRPSLERRFAEILDVTPYRIGD